MITYADKESGDLFTHENANEVKDEVNSLFPRVNATFNPATGVYLDKLGGTIYNQYTQSGALELIINEDITTAIQSSAGALLPILVDGSGVTVTIPAEWYPSGHDPLSPDSNTAATVPGSLDNYVFWVENDRIYYKIINIL